MRNLFAIATRVSAVASVLVALSFASSDAIAGKKKSAPVENTPAASKPQHMDFDDDIVDGTLTSPDYSVVDPTRAVRHGSLIKPRLTFVPELLKSAEDL